MKRMYETKLVQGINLIIIWRDQPSMGVKPIWIIEVDGEFLSSHFKLKDARLVARLKAANLRKHRNPLEKS